MSQLQESIEKSVNYLKARYPENLPLLVDLEKKLAYLKAKNSKENRDKRESEQL